MSESNKSTFLVPIIAAAALGIMTSLVVDIEPVREIIVYPLLRLTIKCEGLLLAASPGTVSYARAEVRARHASFEQSSKDGVAELENMLFSAIRILFDGEPSQRLRANVMIKIGQSLNMLSRKRHFSETVSIAFHSTDGNS
jgi:hypothetical protein